MNFTQWDIVRARINEHDRDEHPAVVLSPPEVCAAAGADKINVLYCTKLKPAESISAHRIYLNAADGLEFKTTTNCLFIHTIAKTRSSAVIGRVSSDRQQQIARRLREIFRLG
ncbi:MAG: type II toxin-antitoxin system PemK/MazF family toxin [Opitutaceae bacterium]|nr:type II toxin-antitoxin system PemK/MazF family toxin [Opitutaceae bacterium]